MMLELAVLCDVGGALATAKCSLREETPLIEKVRFLEPSERVRRYATTVDARLYVRQLVSLSV